MSKNKETKKYYISLIRAIKYFHQLNIYRLKVFKLCCKAGIPLRGFFHDLSKYTIDEFWEGVKYYEKGYNPIKNCKIEKGISKSWLHHVGHNKHHYEYWYDENAPAKTMVMPYKYFVEMICDDLVSGMISEKNEWTEYYPLNRWLETRNEKMINPQTDKLVTKIYTDISKKGLNYILNKKYLQETYKNFIKQ